MHKQRCRIFAPLRMAWIKTQATLEDTLDCGVSRSMMMSYQISPTFETRLPTWALHLEPSAAHSRPHQNLSWWRKSHA